MHCLAGTEIQLNASIYQGQPNYNVYVTVEMLWTLPKKIKRGKAPISVEVLTGDQAITLKFPVAGEDECNGDFATIVALGAHRPSDVTQVTDITRSAAQH